jgi:hypothetical protein
MGISLQSNLKLFSKHNPFLNVSFSLSHTTLFVMKGVIIFKTLVYQKSELCMSTVMSTWNSEPTIVLGLVHYLSIMSTSIIMLVMHVTSLSKNQSNIFVDICWLEVCMFLQQLVYACQRLMIFPCLFYSSSCNQCTFDS